MSSPSASPDRKVAALFAAAGGLLGGLCCLAPIVMVLAGLATVSAANSLGNWLYGEHRWAFRIAAFVLLAAALFVYFRRRGICTLDEARRQRTRIVNVALLAVTTFVAIYVIWVYVVLHYWGIAAGLPWAQWDESWALPASAVLLGVAGWAFYRMRRTGAG